jgi:predicted ATPase/tetratricopeptide (TPR) repeat protein/class 3 adenylate cyclase
MAARAMERALLFTDVVDSTRLTERLGDARAAQLWAAHDRKARELLAAHGVREVERTDGFFLLFDRAADAASFALAYHEALAELGMKARVGLHVGPVSVHENAPDDVARGAKRVEVEGLAKPIAARVLALAGGGQTLMTRAARDALAGTVPEGAEIRRHDYYRFKGIDAPIEIFELGVRGGSPFLPPRDADKAYRVVRSGDAWRPAREVHHNLPAERDVFVGRGAELVALAARLDAGARLVTVQGPGGTGKTRLVRRYGLTWLGDWPGGVYFCDLSDAHSLHAIHFAVARALDVPLGREDPAVQLGHAIAARGRCLVILDNFEQVVEHAAATVGVWLDCAPGAAFLVTSREKLHLRGEETFAIEPLPLAEDAIELFQLRARAQCPGFVVNEGNRADVAEVVRLVDGLPLAIELAAARVRVLSPAQIVQRMRDRFALLAGARGAAARQATLRAAIDWSWDLLAPWEKDAFAQCSVFEGGFTLEAAEAVVDLARWPEAPPVMDVIHALTDKSLLRTWIPWAHDRYAFEEPFFGMYLSIHDYSAGKLEACGGGARAAAEARHGACFAAFGEDHAIEAMFLEGGVRRRREIALEVDNLVVACRRAVSRGDATVAAATLRAVCDVLELTGPYGLGIALGAQVLAIDGIAAPARARALAARAMPLRRSGRIDESGAALEQALALHRGLGDRQREAHVMLMLGNLRRDQGRIDEARTLQEGALALTREIGYRRAEGQALGNLGIIHGEQSRLPEARAHFEQALAIHREVGNRYIEGIDTSNLGNVFRAAGRLDEAWDCYQNALAIDREVGNRRDEGIVMANLGLLSADLDRHEEARALYAAAITIAREVGDRRFEGYVLGSLSTLLSDQGCVEDAMAECERALDIHRAVGNRHQEGVALGTLGGLLAKLGRIDEARDRLRAGDALLREVGDRFGRASLLCEWASVEATAGANAAANDVLAQAACALDEAGAGLDCEPGRRLASLRDRLNRATDAAAS